MIRLVERACGVEHRSMFEMAFNAAHHVVGWDEGCDISLLAKAAMLAAGLADKGKNKAFDIARCRF